MQPAKPARDRIRGGGPHDERALRFAGVQVFYRTLANLSGGRALDSRRQSRPMTDGTKKVRQEI